MRKSAIFLAIILSSVQGFAQTTATENSSTSGTDEIPATTDTLFNRVTEDMLLNESALSTTLAQDLLSTQTAMEDEVETGTVTRTRANKVEFAKEEESLLRDVKELAKQKLIDNGTAMRIKLFLKSLPTTLKENYIAAKPFFQDAKRMASNYALHPYADIADENIEYAREFFELETEPTAFWVYHTTMKNTVLDIAKAFPDLLRVGRESGYATEAIKNDDLRDFTKLKVAAAGYGMDALRAGAVLDIMSGGRVTGAIRSYLIKKYPVLGANLGREKIRHITERPTNGQSRLLASDDVGGVEVVYAMKPEATPARISDLRQTFLKVRELEKKGNIKGAIKLLHEKGISSKTALQDIPYETGSGTIAGKTQELEWILSQFLRTAEKAQLDASQRGALTTWIQIARVHFLPEEG